jgi:hypothetical protein
MQKTTIDPSKTGSSPAKSSVTEHEARLLLILEGCTIKNYQDEIGCKYLISHPKSEGISVASATFVDALRAFKHLKVIDDE